MNKREIGNKGEDAVCRFLEKKGYRIVKRNYFCPKGEIDIIAENNDTLAFVEVKARKENCVVTGAEAVDFRKKQRIFKTAAWYTYTNPLEKQPRFDIAEIILKNNMPYALRYYEGAFDMSGCDIMLSFK